MGSDTEQSDSMINNYDKSEFEGSSVPINHCTPPATNVLLMNSYFDFIYAKAIIGVRDVVVKSKCYGCLIDHPSQSEHDCIMDDFLKDAEHAYEF